MKKVLIVCAHRPGRSPSQRYRFEQYLPFLEEHGFTFTWSNLLTEAEDGIFYSAGNTLRKALIILAGLARRLRDVLRTSSYDIIFIQREASFLGLDFFERAAAKSRAKVIFDFDDSIWLADTSPGNKKYEWLKRPGKFFDNVKHADTVIAGNEYLAAAARKFNGRVVIIPTTIDTRVHYRMAELRGTSKVVIGWSGSISTVKHFNLLENVFLQLKKEFGELIGFRMIADKQYNNAALGLEVVKWQEKTEVQELNRFDIGVMPLPDDEWSKGKCGLKGLSYMACGLTTVMSPVGVNATIINHRHNGMLASSDAEWLVCLRELILDRQLRDKLGAEGRKTIERLYSVEANKDLYLQVFNGS